MREISQGANRGVVSHGAVPVCAVEIAHGADLRIGASMLMALTSYPREDPAQPLTELIAALRRQRQDDVADAIAAQVALDRGDLGDALARLRTAHDGHAPGGSLARLASELAPRLYDAGRLGDTQEAIALGLDAMAPCGGDADELRGSLRVSQTMFIMATGDLDLALQQIDAQLARGPRAAERAWIHRTRVEVLYERHGPRQAEEEVWETVKWAWIAAVIDGAVKPAIAIQSSAYYCLSGLLREQGRFDEAERALDLALWLTPEDATAEKLFYRALIHRDRGELDRAEAGLLAALVGGVGSGADGKPPVGDLVTAIPIELARIRLRRSDVDGAEQALRQAIATIEELRASIPASDGQLIAKYRQGYEELLGILAGRQRWSEALELLARLDAGRFYSDIGAPRSPAVADHELGAAVRSSPNWQPPSSAQGRAPATAAEVLAAWRGRHLVAVFRGGEQLCRLEADATGLHGTCMGAWEPLERAAEALRELPGDVVAARRLGAALIPPGTDRLDLLLVGPIVRAPVAALQDERGLVVARRPLERVLGLLEDVRPLAGDGPARVVGYAGHDRSAVAAEREAAEVGRTLAVRPALGAEATRAVVLAGDARVLHVAGHAHMIEGVPQLELADGDLSADTIAGSPRAPRLVVLASCDSATARDAAGWGSLAAAFLHAGSDGVIASDRAVDDAEAQALMRGFYAADGVHDPARALGLSQAARAAGLAADARPPAATTWAAFAVIAAPPRVPAPPAPPPPPATR